jgi:hypothetical protein
MGQQQQQQQQPQQSQQQQQQQALHPDQLMALQALAPPYFPGAAQQQLPLVLHPGPGGSSSGAAPGALAPLPLPLLPTAVGAATPSAGVAAVGGGGEGLSEVQQLRLQLKHAQEQLERQDRRAAFLEEELVHRRREMDNLHRSCHSKDAEIALLKEEQRREVARLRAEKQAVEQQLQQRVWEAMTQQGGMVLALPGPPQPPPPAAAEAAEEAGQEPAAGDA